MTVMGQFYLDFSGDKLTGVIIAGLSVARPNVNLFSIIADISVLSVSISISLVPSD